MAGGLCGCTWRAAIRPVRWRASSAKRSDRSAPGGGKRREDFSRRGLHILVQAVSVRVHCDNGGEITDLEMPHGFGRAELGQRYTVHAFDAAGIELRGAADAVQI